MTEDERIRSVSVRLIGSIPSHETQLEHIIKTVFYRIHTEECIIKEALFKSLSELIQRNKTSNLDFIFSLRSEKVGTIVDSCFQCISDDESHFVSTSAVVLLASIIQYTYHLEYCRMDQQSNQIVQTFHHYLNTCEDHLVLSVLDFLILVGNTKEFDSFSSLESNRNLANRCTVLICHNDHLLRERSVDLINVLSIRNYHNLIFQVKETKNTLDLIIDSPEKPQTMDEQFNIENQVMTSLSILIPEMISKPGENTHCIECSKTGTKYYFARGLWQTTISLLSHLNFQSIEGKQWIITSFLSILELFKNVKKSMEGDDGNDDDDDEEEEYKKGTTMMMKKKGTKEITSPFSKLSAYINRRENLRYEVLSVVIQSISRIFQPFMYSSFIGGNNVAFNYVQALSEKMNNNGVMNNSDTLHRMIDSDDDEDNDDADGVTFINSVVHVMSECSTLWESLIQIYSEKDSLLPRDLKSLKQLFKTIKSIHHYKLSKMDDNVFPPLLIEFTLQHLYDDDDTTLICQILSTLSVCYFRMEVVSISLFFLICCCCCCFAFCCCCFVHLICVFFR
eukprot:TRINITY_DN1486_c0_g1_i7.p1 TRINITY_DN1486_c0_g1~~TRINITY_DN1486_c0_g1_i7.p1  ORF type:complete len:564 (+),score=90.23 TRINITY_DN1486_c0_g1_i7:142-1833(+)